MTLLDRAVKYLLPREAAFFDLLERGAECAKDSGTAMLALCEAKAGADREQRLKVLRDIEHAADAVIHETYDTLNRTFVTPLDRSDIYALATQLEEIVDLNHATAMQLIVHAMDDVPEGSIPLASLIAESTKEVASAVVLLRTLRRHAEVHQHTQQMSKLEHDGDEIFRNRLGALFRTQKDAIQLIQHKEFLEGLERTLDACDHVGTSLKTIVIKNA